jgi:hypothetical protein
MGAVQHVLTLWLCQSATEMEGFSRPMSVFAAKPHVSWWSLYNQKQDFQDSNQINKREKAVHPFERKS